MWHQGLKMAYGTSTYLSFVFVFVCFLPSMAALKPLASE